MTEIVLKPEITFDFGDTPANEATVLLADALGEDSRTITLGRLITLLAEEIQSNFEYSVWGSVKVKLNNFVVRTLQ